jgi:hypothetical protein
MKPYRAKAVIYEDEWNSTRCYLRAGFAERTLAISLVPLHRGFDGLPEAPHTPSPGPVLRG